MPAGRDGIVGVGISTRVYYLMKKTPKRKGGASEGKAAEAEAAAEAAAGADAAAFGPWLRRQREGREIDLREIADASKISLGHLKAMEENRFDLLPAPVFTKGFLRQYAGYVGLDPEEVVNAYLAARQAMDDDKDESQPSELRSRKPRRSRSNLRLVLAAILVAALLLGAVWLLAELRDGDGSLFGTWRAADAPTLDTASATDAAGSTSSSVPVANAATGTAATGTAATGTAAADLAAASQPAVEPVPSAPLVVVLDFVGDCWIEAQADGQRRLAEMHIQGESLQLEAQRQVTLKVGDITQVRAEVNGAAYDLEGRSTGSGTVRTVAIDLEQLDLDRGDGINGDSPASGAGVAGAEVAPAP